MGSIQIKKISHRHEAIMDWLLANPHEKNLAVLCDQLNVSRSWLSTVMNTNAFKAKFEERRREYNRMVGQDVISKQLKVLDRALDHTLDYLEQDPEEQAIDPEFAFNIADKMSKNLGFSPSRGGAPMIEETRERVVEEHDVHAGTLRVARERMRRTLVGEEPQAALPAPEED